MSDEIRKAIGNPGQMTVEEETAWRSAQGVVNRMEFVIDNPQLNIVSATRIMKRFALRQQWKALGHKSMDQFWETRDHLEAEFQERRKLRARKVRDDVNRLTSNASNAEIRDETPGNEEVVPADDIDDPGDDLTWRDFALAAIEAAEESIRDARQYVMACPTTERPVVAHEKQ